MALHEYGDLGLGDPPLGHAEDELDQVVVRRLEPPAVETQERQHRHERRALVAVDERVILHEVEAVSGRVSVQGEDLVEREELDAHYSASCRNTPA